MKNIYIKGLIVFAFIFIALFVFRLAYGYVVIPSNASDRLSDYSISQNSRLQVKKNYASYKQKIQLGHIRESAFRTVEQKYEKISTIISQARDFVQDNKKVRAIIKDNDSLIQSERSTGSIGRRRLELSIGVPPDKFDYITEQIKQIGDLKDIQINKTDKTNEYRELKAKQDSLIKTKGSLVLLKKRSASVRELIELENRILEVEQKLQDLGVSLGNYDEENEFCTIQFTLKEVKAASIPLLHRIMVAFAWAVKYYLAILMMTTFGLFTLVLGRYLWNNWFKTIYEKITK